MESNMKILLSGVFHLLKHFKKIVEAWRETMIQCHINKYNNINKYIVLSQGSENIIFQFFQINRMFLFSTLNIW